MSFEDVMNLPIRSFFALYREGIQMEARQYRELLRIQGVNKFTLPYFERLQSAYEGMIHMGTKELPPRPPMPGMDMTSTQTKNVMIDFFAVGKRAYVGR